MKNRITELFGIRYPIVQGGMVWCSGWKLAAAVSHAGGLGLLGSGSMSTPLVREHILRLREATDKPFGVNIPLLYPHAADIVRLVIAEKVPIVFTSAGNPSVWTPVLKAEGIHVAHVVANSRFMRKAEEAGVDAVVAEGFEAGGHNGREETTTFSLIPLLRQETSLPLLAAGGIATGRTMLAAMILGAEGVQVGSRFAVSAESSAHPSFKEAVVRSKEGDTMLTLKALTPVRMLKNTFYHRLEEAIRRGASAEEQLQILGQGRTRTGIFEGDLEEGELAIGQAAALIHSVQPVRDIMKEMMDEYHTALREMPRGKYRLPAFQ